MVSGKVTVKNPSGLHARPASILARAAGQCESEVILVYGEKKIQAKSILNIMAAAIKSGSEIEVQCSGESEEKDLKTLIELIEGGLGE
ncbi:MAG: HPr family phosphocarrier protein [Lachnospiraceae bacterium]|nr:HPr family phosphocarrier protein [Lachnospiraceae bacterium]